MDQRSKKKINHDEDLAFLFPCSIQIAPQALLDLEAPLINLINSSPATA